MEGMKSILVCDLFYQAALDTTRPLPKTTCGDKYVIIAIDHYSKWCEARPMREHDIITVAKFLEEEIICRFGMPKNILTNNGSKWMNEFDVLCQDYDIIH